MDQDKAQQTTHHDDSVMGITRITTIRTGRVLTQGMLYKILDAPTGLASVNVYGRRYIGTLVTTPAP